MYDHNRLFVRVYAVLTETPGASLHRIAGMLRVHPHTVAQVVREHTGISFSAWRGKRRLAVSCTLLRTRADLSIKEIAGAAGFSSTSVFDRFMRRTCGRSPSQCRDSSDDGTAVGPKVNALDDRSTLTRSHHEPCSATLDSSTASSFL